MSIELFELINDELGRYESNLEGRRKQKRLHFPLSQLQLIAHKLFSNIKNNGYCTLPVPGKPAWNPKSPYYQWQRDAAKKGAKIERAFLFPLKHLYSDPIVQKHIELDIASGIAIHCLYIGTLLKENKLTFIDSLEFGLWDNDLVLTPLFEDQTHTAIELIVSSNEEDIEIAQCNWNTLIQSAPDLRERSHLNQGLNLEEPMLTTAPVAEFLAKVLCKGNQVDKDDCYWYHSIWQYLRILDAVSTPTWHANFYFEQLRKLISTGNSLSLLISGTADYSILAHVLWAFNDFPKENLCITVLDLCETPLFLCKWYSSLVNHNIKTVSHDIFTFEPKQNFDIIVTDAFLTRFPLEMREKIISKWHSLLNDDGAIVTTVRIGGSKSGEPRNGSIAQAEQFVLNIRSSGRYWRDFLPIPLDDLERRAMEYALKMTSYSAGQVKDVISLFEQKGFKIMYSSENEVKGELLPTVYLDLVAKKNKQD